MKIMQADPKNKHRKGELECCIIELEDYFFGENIYGTTEEQITAIGSTTSSAGGLDKPLRGLLCFRLKAV